MLLFLKKQQTDLKKLLSINHCLEWFITSLFIYFFNFLHLNGDMFKITPTYLVLVRNKWEYEILKRPANDESFLWHKVETHTQDKQVCLHAVTKVNIAAIALNKWRHNTHILTKYHVDLQICYYGKVINIIQHVFIYLWNALALWFLPCLFIYILIGFIGTFAAPMSVRFLIRYLKLITQFSINTGKIWDNFSISR